MKKVLFISFDLIRSGEIEKPYAVASILVYLKQDKKLYGKFEFDHISFNMLTKKYEDYNNIFAHDLALLKVENYQFIALSAYVWNEFLINDFIKELRLQGFKGSVILGGYQITYSNNELLPQQYPDAQVFVSGYAEQALSDYFVAESTNKTPLFINSPVDFTQMPSAYLSNEVHIPSGTSMLRMETSRGCPYKCSFCAHRDLTQNRVFRHYLDKVFQEIALFTDKNVGRVNILDPVFNAGRNSIEIMKELNKTNISTTYTLQSRFENIKGEYGYEFLDLCGDGIYHLEFGLQTAIEAESVIINRKNNIKLIDEAMKGLAERGISYEVSLIYGLPGQTVDSFKRSIEFVANRGCKLIKAYPLMLFRGTELFNEKEKWAMQEEITGDFSIPVVTASSSFTRNDWETMSEIAGGLMANQRF